ncbi:ubiquitin conjugating enzyme E2 [Aspergillus luchuensis]|uniref:Ubiquitin conjugating enzyme E2 n=1 Tax=Aspergillus kawachii TaxID=1069201 RepID=A0A146FCI6_ASPKA|nr:ubiquitin conjugating enzyme E2 [Aspergillus luchuensis]
MILTERALETLSLDSANGTVPLSDTMQLVEEIPSPSYMKYFRCKQADGNHEQRAGEPTIFLLPLWLFVTK